jgi:hypothetical protein
MKTLAWRTLVLAVIASFVVSTGQAATINFSDVPLAPDSYYSGNPGGTPPDGNYGGPFSSGGMTFPNQYVVSFGGSYTYVDGWAASNKVVAPPAAGSYGSNFQPQYQFSVPGGSTGNYALTFLSNSDLVLPAGTKPTSMQVNNLTYSYLSMRDGDGFAKKFGGVSGNDEDFFKLTIQGLSSSNALTGTVTFNLADFLGSNTTIVNTWQTIDLTPLGNATKLAFSLSSSDNDPTFGMNTPAAFAMDNLVITAVPEPTSIAGLFCFVAGVCCWRRQRRTNAS